VIKGAKVWLRAVEAEDAERYHQWINDPVTNDQRGLYHPLSQAQAAAYVADKAPSPEALTLTVCRGGGDAIGLIGLRGICARSRRAEIWIYLGERSEWGKGFGTEAIRLLTDYAFDEMNLHRIWLECDPDNSAAVRSYEKNGFRLEGRHRDGYFRHGRFRDTVVMGVLRTDRE
jgi:RimJ/RimL family protein N-acetyltransferase